MKPPIADPFEPSPDQEPWRTFPIRFWRFFLTVTALAFSLSLPVVWFLLRNERVEAQRGALTAGLSAGLAAGLLLSILSVYLLPTKVNRHKLRSTDIYGLEREIEWSQIEKVRYFWFVLSFGVISTPTKRNFIWLPLFLRDMNGFARAVEEMAPVDNPLRLFLQKRGF